jgi:Polysaccharide lyase
MFPLSPRNTIIAFAVALAAFLAAASTASASLLWTANAERPEIQEWANHSCQSGDRVHEVNSPVAQGRRSYRIDVKDGDDSYGERCELGQANPTRAGFPLFHEGDERWIGYQMYLPADMDTNPGRDPHNWTVIMQFKQLGSLGTPAVSMDFQENRFILMNSDTNHESSGCNWWWEHPVVKGRWIKFLYHIKFSPDKSVGWLELYADLDGNGLKQELGRTPMWTMKVDNNGHTVDSHARIGLYRDPEISGAAHAFFDGYSVGTDRDSVVQAAFGATDVVVPPTTNPQPPVSNPPASNPPASNPPGSNGDPSPSHRSHRRVWLRLKRNGMMGAAAAAAAGPWGRLLPVFGGVRPKRGRGNTVILEMRRHHRWVWLERNWVRPNRRFYLSPSLGFNHGRVLKLRAVVRGVGHSRVLKVHV